MNKTELSVEFFPPNHAEGMERLRAVRAELNAIDPAFFSVTYGAGGVSYKSSLNTVEQIIREAIPEACPHLTCVGASRDWIRQLLNTYRQLGIRRLVALRGDLPSGVYGSNEFRYACDLVSFIRSETGNHFHISVAVYPEWHPQASSPRDDLLAFQRKVDAGANAAITQFFYNADAYLNYVDEARTLGITTPIIPGIMPIASFSNLARFSDNCGCEIPRWLRRKFESFSADRNAIRALGIDVVTQLCERLLAHGAPGLHFYSMNQSSLVLEICRRLGLLLPR